MVGDVKPVTVSVEVPQSPEEVFDYIDVLANHEQFTDHFLVDWETSGPEGGVGAKARMRVKKPGAEDWLDMEVIESERPRRNVERARGANGKRLTQGSYDLEPIDGGGTKISFELAWLEAPRGERLMSPITRAVTKSSNAKSLRRLSERLA
jgi:uncharacterized protein YndB with AHSA1/START domain